VKETNFGILPVQLFEPVEVSVGARVGVEKAQPTGAASIVSHAQVQGPAVRRHVFARLVAVRDFNTAELAAITYPVLTSAEK